MSTPGAALRRMRPRPGRLLLLLACLLCGACAYRAVSPQQPSDGIRVEVTSRNLRIPATKQSVQSEVSRTLAHKLGWPVRPDGSARLLIHLDGERIDPASSSNQGVTNRWTINLRATVSLEGLGSPRQTTTSAQATYSTLDNEQQGIETASASLANAIGSWLMAQTTGR